MLIINNTVLTQGIKNELEVIRKSLKRALSMNAIENEINTAKNALLKKMN